MNRRCEAGKAAKQFIRYTAAAVLLASGIPAASFAQEQEFRMQAASEADEIEVFDQGGITVSLTGLDGSNTDGTVLRFRVENRNSQDVIVSTVSYQINVNGTAMDSSPYAQVQSGEFKETELVLCQSDLTFAGIDRISELSFSIRIIDEDTYDHLYDGNQICLLIDENDRITEKSACTDQE